MMDEKERSCENCGVMPDGSDVNCAICMVAQYLDFITPGSGASLYDQPENLVCPFWRPMPGSTKAQNVKEE